VRVLLVNHTARTSGAERALLDLVECLGERCELFAAVPPGRLAGALRERGVEVAPIVPFEASLRFDPARTPLGLLSLARAQLAIAGQVGRVRPAVVFANTPRAGLMALLARRLQGVPLVVRVHDNLPARGAGRLVARLLAGAVDAVSCVSHDTLARFREAAGGHARAQLGAIHNGIDLGRFRPDPDGAARVRRELELTADAPLLVQVAQITPWKGQDIAVRTLAGLRARGMPATLALVGDVAFSGASVRYDNRSFARELRRLACTLGVADHVLVPSWCEPFGLVTVESMACATPPLVSREGAGPELVADGDSGVLLPPRDPTAWVAAAETLLRDRELRLRIGERARVAAERFDRRRYADAIGRLLREVAAREVGT
jgi:glycosyltransferase involved in cell wall biosynthesis